MQYLLILIFILFFACDQTMKLESQQDYSNENPGSNTIRDWVNNDPEFQSYNTTPNNGSMIGNNPYSGLTSGAPGGTISGATGGPINGTVGTTKGSTTPPGNPLGYQ